MRILFFEPPAAQRLGGLDAAVCGLRDALRMLGDDVCGELPADGSMDNIQAVHFHGLWQPRYLQAANRCLRSGVPYIVSPHGMLEPWAWRHKFWKKWPYYFLFERRFLRNASCILATAQSEAQRLVELLPGRRVETLPLGMTRPVGPDYEAARIKRGWQPDERILLFLSRIHVKKGLNLLLEALQGICIPEKLRLVIVGGGDADYVESLKRFTRKNEDQLPRIDWEGEIWGDERWSYFQGADLFCLPTHSENFGLAVLEALQVGTPVLTTRTTPWGEYLTPERGILADPTVESLKSSLNEFLAAPQRPLEIRRRTSLWAHSTFSWSELAPKYRALYAAL